MKSCVKACGVMAAVLMAACGSAAAQVIISEVVSGSMLSANPKFVELTNVSATQTITLGATDTLRIYSNTNTTSTVVYDFGANEGANNVTLSPGQSWTIALGGSTAGTSWTAAYGANQPNLFLPFPGGPAGNGNDVYELQIAGVRSDIYGIVPGNPGATTSSSDFSMPWAYSRGYAKRLPNVCVPNATFTIGEWAIGGNNSLGTSNTDANAQAMATNTTPNSHATICLTGNDCNGNGRPDATDIATGTSQDCNANAVPDECDISSGGSRDCNFNGRPDDCEIAELPSRDCNTNGVLDSCEIANNDCNNNGILDSCDIASGVSVDANGNGRPDSCEPFVFDCNGNGIEDATDIANATSVDCNANVIPDECELFNGRLTDANANGTPDWRELPLADIDRDGTLDACEIAAGARDCNSDGIPDADQIRTPRERVLEGPFPTAGMSRTFAFSGVRDATAGSTVEVEVYAQGHLGAGAAAGEFVRVSVGGTMIEGAAPRLRRLRAGRDLVLHVLRARLLHVDGRAPPVERGFFPRHDLRPEAARLHGRVTLVGRRPARRGHGPARGEGLIPLRRVDRTGGVGRAQTGPEDQGEEEGAMRLHERD